MKIQQEDYPLRVSDRGHCLVVGNRFDELPWPLYDREPVSRQPASSDSSL